MKKFIVALCLLFSGFVHAQPLRYTANFGRTDAASQFHVYSSVLNTPTLQFALTQGATPYSPPAGTGVYFAYGKSDSDPAMTFLYGTLSGSTATIQVQSNDFPIAVDGWYASLVLTSSVQSLSVRGQITIRRSPEISAFGVLSKTYAINGTEYGPFSGDFTGWPFIGKDADLGLIVTNAVQNEGISAAPWSSFPATQTVNMANNSITNAGNIQAVSINGDGAAIDIPHIHGTLAGNIYIHIRNGTGSTIAKGTPVYVIGNVGAGDRKLVAPAQSSDPTKMPAIALAEANLTANADGDGVILGEIRTYNTVTNAWTVNTELYVAPLGGLTKTAPTSGLVQSVGQVSRTNSVNGIIVAQIQGAVLPKESFLSSTNVYVTVETDAIALAALTNYQTTVQADAKYATIGSFATTGTVASLETNVIARLASNVWAAADSTTNYALRTTFAIATNSLQTNVNARLASNVWAAADSTTNYARRTGETFTGILGIDESGSGSDNPSFALRFRHRNLIATSIVTDVTATTGGLRRTTTGSSAATIWDSINLANPIVNNQTNVTLQGTFSGNGAGLTGLIASATNAVPSITLTSAVQNAVTFVGSGISQTGSTFNWNGYLTQSTWATADSTTNYAPQTSFVSVSNTVVAIGTNVAARLASNVWASADSTTNYASRITFNATSNALNSSITSLAARAFVYSTNLTAIAGSGLGVTSNQLVVTNIPTTFEALTGNRFVLGNGSLANIATNAIGASMVGEYLSGVFSIGSNSVGSSQIGRFGGGLGTVKIEESVYGAVQRGSFVQATIGTESHGASQQGLISGTAAIGVEAYGASQQGYITFLGTATIGEGASAASQQGYIAGTATIGDYAIAASQRGYMGGTATIEANTFGASQQGYIGSGGTATIQANAHGASQLMGGFANETYLTTTNGRGSILVGPGTNNVAYSVRAAGGFFGNAAGLTNFPSSILTVSAGNAAYWRITTAPTGATSSGSSGQMAVDGTNLFIYSPNALGVGTARWLRVSGDVSW